MPRRSKWTKDQWEVLANKIKRLIKEDKLPRIVAAKCGCSEQHVRNVMMGLKPTYFKKE